MTEDGHALLQRLRPLLTSRDTPVYLVGGAVRDALLGRQAYDLDFVLARDAIGLAFAVADELSVAAYVLDRERDIGRVVIGSHIVLDFARFRGPDLIADLRARDFTINAMAVEIGQDAPIPADRTGRGLAIDPEALVDPCDGLVDLEARVLRLTHPGAIQDDPLRALRSVRLCWQLGFTMAPATATAARRAAPQIGELSAERVRDELLKLLRGPDAHQALRQLADLQLLAATLPEIEALRGAQQSAPHHEPVLAHTISVLQRLLQVEEILAEDELPPEPLPGEIWRALSPFRHDLRQHLEQPVDGLLDRRAALRLGALFHDVGKARTASREKGGRIRFFGHDKEGATLASRRLRALRLSNEAVTTVRAIVAGHMRPLHLTQSFGGDGRITRRAVYRFFRDTAGAGLDIVLLSLADHLATYDGQGPRDQWQALLAVADRLLNHYFERYEETVAPPPLLHGGELIEALNLQPGPLIGHLLRLIEEAQASGEVGSREEALELAKREAETGD